MVDRYAEYSFPRICGQSDCEPSARDSSLDAEVPLLGEGKSSLKVTKAGSAATHTFSQLFAGLQAFFPAHPKNLVALDFYDEL